MNQKTRPHVLVDRLAGCSDEEIRAMSWLARLHIEESEELNMPKDDRWDVLAEALAIEERRRQMEVAQLEALYFGS